jgi:nucleotide-binding universal stress UspA family protein
MTILFHHSPEEPAMSKFRKILVPVDGSETSHRALTMALQMARDAGGKVRLVHCMDELAYLGGFEYSGAYLGQVRDGATRLLTEAPEICGSAGVEAETQLVERPGQRLGETMAEQARQWDADLIVVGTHGRRGIGRVLLGSGAEQITRLSPVPVLPIRGVDTRA